MGMDDAGHEPFVLGPLEQLDVRGRGPGDVPFAGRNRVLARDRRHGMDGEPAPASPLPGVGLDAGFAAEDIGGGLDPVLAQEKAAQRIEVRFPDGQVEQAHAAHSNAVSTRLSMVQIPSTPVRHSLLWRDQRCQQRP